MSGKFPTALHAADNMRAFFNALMTPRSVWPITRLTAIEQDPFHGVEARRFDMTLSDGRIYRVRVSDITPPREKETA